MAYKGASDLTRHLTEAKQTPHTMNSKLSWVLVALGAGLLSSAQSVSISLVDGTTLTPGGTFTLQVQQSVRLATPHSLLACHTDMIIRPVRESWASSPKYH